MGGCSSGLRRAMRYNDLEAMEELLQEAGEGAPDLINEDNTADCCLDWLTACCHGNHSPLHTAVMKQHVAMTTLLLRYGADVTASNEHGNTALHVAAGANHAELCRLLIKQGADVNARNGRGESPAFHAIVTPTCRLSNSTTALDCLLECAADVSVTDCQGNSLLHAAATSDNQAAVKRLLQQSMDTAVTNNRGDTPAQVARPACKPLLS